VEIRPLVIPCTTVSLYGSETSALTRALQDKVDAFDNMCLRRILRISYTDHITNTMVKLHAGSPPQLSQLIQVRRLRFFLYTWQGWIRHLTSRPEHSVFTRGLQGFCNLQGLETTTRSSSHHGSRSPTS